MKSKLELNAAIAAYREHINRALIVPDGAPVEAFSIIAAHCHEAAKLSYEIRRLAMARGEFTVAAGWEGGAGAWSAARTSIASLATDVMARQTSKK